jgi:hypothetical protein
MLIDTALSHYTSIHILGMTRAMPFVVSALYYSDFSPFLPALSTMRLCNYSSLIAGCVAASVAAACSLTTAPASPTTYGSGPHRILLIGNSLMSANQMPAMVVALAEAAKVSPLPTVDVYWAPDHALIGHWLERRVQDVIKKGHYKIVVLQQDLHPSR